MSGRVPPSSRARIRRAPSRASDARRAASLYERFSGHDCEVVGEVQLPPHPRALAVIGPCDAISYTTVRDGRVEKYIHHFRAEDRPMLCTSPNGRQLYLVDGRYDFTELGIVDATDAKHSPRLRRFRR